MGAEFVSRGAGYAVLVNSTGVTLRFGEVFRMRLEGANPAAEAELLEPFDSFSHYLRGQSWQTDVPTYARLVYHQVYPGIDVAYHGNPSRLEYDFIVAPGSDPAAIRMSFAPGDEATVSADGDVIVHTPKGELRQFRPRMYQQSSEENLEVNGAYVPTGVAEIGFRVGEYDRDKPLIIDPTLTYSSYFGGSADDSISAIALDAEGNVYVAGWTDSVEFPVENATQSSDRGGVDAFVAKLNPAGTALLYATYLGGRYSDRAAGIAVDASGCAVIAGSTQSPDFPTLNAFQGTLHGSSDAFVAKLNAEGNGLVFSTYLGGSGQESGNAVALDTAGNIYVTGNTNSANFPTLNAYQAAIRGSQNAFLVKLSPSGSLIYGTYLGGSLSDSGNGVAVDSFGNAYVAGGTTSPNFPVVGGVQTQNAGGQDAFVTKFDAAGTSLVYSTYLGGSGGTTSLPEMSNAIALDSAGDAYVTGETPSANFPLANAFQASIDGSLDAFVTELNPSGSAIVYSSYLGGSSVDYGNAIAVDLSGAAYVAGYTASTDFPLVDPIQAANAGSYDAFVVKVAPGGASLVFSTYLGGENADAANAIALDTSGNIYLAGQTLSYAFPTVTPLQASNPGGYGGFVASIRVATPPSVFIVSPASGAAVSGTITITGWSIDNTVAVGTAISGVQVFVDGTEVGNATYGLSQPDVCAAYPGRPGCPNVGFSFVLNTAALALGSHTIVVTATDTDSIPLTGSASVVVNVTSIGPPSVWIDSPVAGAAVSGTVTVIGWAMESRAAVGTAIGSVRVFVDGTAVGNATYGLSRPDVCYVYPGRPGCPNVGFSFALNTAALTPGSHTIVVTATDTASPPVTGSASVTVTAGSAGMTPSAAVAAPAHGAFTSLHCTPASLTSGETSACTVTLSSPAGSGGLTVTLASSAAALTVPGSVTVAAGASMATFAASAGAVASAQTAVVTASWNTASETASIGLQPASSQSGASIACNPDSNKVGGLDCGVSLAQAAPASGVTVALQANTSRVQVPAQVSIAAGALSARFAAAVISSDQDAQAQITASVQGALTTATIPITGIRPTSLSCAPQTVQAGGFFTCTVGMNNPNVLQVARLAVSSSSPSLELPSPFMTRPGQAQLSFEVFTTPFAGQQSSAVTVQFGETAVTSTVEVTPAAAPMLNLPGTQMAAFGKPMSFAISAVDPGGLPLTLSAANLPPGASFDPATGEFLWTPQAPSSLNQRLGASSPLERREVTFTATNSARKSSTGSVTIEADPGLPVITGLRNAASQQSQAVLPKERVTAQPTPTSCSPGSLASLLGRWLGAGAQPTASPTGSSTELEGAAVIVNGNPAPVVYASATRVDFLCPEALPGGELEISAQVGGTVTNVIHANQQATLGLFSADGSGQGQAMVTLSGTSLLATPRSYLNDGQPAEPGDTISILATGAGLDAGPALVEVSIGGVSTTADRVQPMPGMAGVYQVDVTVPASVAPGDAVPIAIEIADSSGIAIGSNTVTIAVEARQSGQP